MGKQENKNRKLEIQKLQQALSEKKSEILKIQSERDALKKNLESAVEKIKNLEASLSNLKNSVKPARKINGWNIVKSGGYYRAHKRIGGTLRTVYIGKTLRGAAAKIREKSVSLAVGKKTNS